MSRKLFTAVLVGIALICLNLVTNKSSVQAGVVSLCSGSNPYGVADCQGYFKGQSGASDIYYSTNVLSYGIYAEGANANVSYLEAVVSGDLNDGNCASGETVTQIQNQMGAAFIIDTMMGDPAPAEAGLSQCGIVAGADSNYNNWVARVNYVNSLGPGGPSNYGIDWSYPESFPADTGLDSAYFPSIYDDAFHTWYPALDNGLAILFTFPGGSFSLGQDCGNVQDTANALPAVPPPTNPTASIKVTCEVSNPDDYQVYVTFSDPSFPTTGTIATSGWNGNNPYSVRSGSTTVVTANSPYASQPVYLYVADDGSTYTYTANTQSCVTFACNPTVTPSVFDPYTPFQVQVAVTNSANQAPPGTMNMQLNISPQNGGSYSYNSSQAVVNNSATFSNLGPTHSSGEYSVTATITGTYSTHCATSFSVSNLPYLQIFGGDTITGASPTSASGQCSEQSAAGVYSWNNGTPNFSGAGDQYAVQAVGQIEDFASAQKSSPPTGLSFANTTGVTQSQGLFGGDFGAYTSDCNFTSDLSGITQQAGSSVTVPSSVSGTVDIYASGNVYIKNNVIYSGSGSWTTPSQIPDFRLVVVGGNIYVDSSVTELDGLYVAESNGTTGGTIYTCATGGLPSPAYGPTGAASAISNYYQTCNKQLKIYGSFVAQKVEFLRTYGTVGQATSSDTATSNHSAEVFDYTPEMWLPRGTGTPNSGYTAITGLPPVL